MVALKLDGLIDFFGSLDGYRFIAETGSACSLWVYQGQWLRCRSLGLFFLIDFAQLAWIYSIFWLRFGLVGLCL